LGAVGSEPQTEMAMWISSYHRCDGSPNMFWAVEVNSLVGLHYELHNTATLTLINKKGLE
jgi:hypothetical protein